MFFVNNNALLITAHDYTHFIGFWGICSITLFYLLYIERQLKSMNFGDKALYSGVKSASGAGIATP